MTVELHDTPFRHYKITNPVTGKVTWTGRDNQRVQSVTDILDPDGGALMAWAVGRTVAAAEVALRDYLPETQPVLARSVLDFPGLMQATGEMPDTVRDAKAELGTEAHKYLALRLAGRGSDEAALAVRSIDRAGIEYGYRLAIDDFIAEWQPSPVTDEQGPRIERAVGSFYRAIAGTYDAQVFVSDGFGTRHRIDLKSSRGVYGKALAQLAAYEDLAVRDHGETPSDWLTVVHIDPMGNYTPHSIATGSPEHDAALAYFEAAVTLRRAGALLDRVVR